MPISYVEMFHPQQMDAVGQILAGGTNALSGAINNSVQLGRDMVNLRAAQEKEYLAERGRTEELGQRRAEFLTKQDNVNRDFYRDVFTADREFDYRAELNDRKFEDDIYRDDRDYALRERGVLSAITARQNDANYRNEVLRDRDEALRLRAQGVGGRGGYNPALGAWVMGKGEMPGAAAPVDDYSSMFPTRPAESAPTTVDVVDYNTMYGGGGGGRDGSASSGGTFNMAAPHQTVSPLPGAAVGVAAGLVPAAPDSPVASTFAPPAGIKPDEDADAIKFRIKTAQTLASKTQNPEEAAMYATRAVELADYAAKKQDVERKVQTIQNIELRTNAARAAKGIDRMNNLSSAMEDLSRLTKLDKAVLTKMDVADLRAHVLATGLDIRDDRITKLFDTVSQYKREVEKSGEPEAPVVAPTPGLFDGAAPAAAAAVSPSKAEALEIIAGIKAAKK